MSENTFYYVEFEPFVDSGHRLHTANSYPAKLSENKTFDRYVLVAPFNKLSTDALNETLYSYNSFEFSLLQLHTPEHETTNIQDVSKSLVIALIKQGLVPGMDSIVYTHMPSPFALLSLYTAVRIIADNYNAHPRVLIRLCMIDEEWDWYRIRLSKLITMIQTDSRVGRQFLFTSESTRLSEYYQDRCKLSVPIQFNPFSNNELLATRYKHLYHKNIYGGRINFAYLGEAREEKGFQYLPKLIAALRKQNIPFNFKIHAFANPLNETDLIRNTRDILIAMASDFSDVEVVLYPVPSSIYNAHQRLADVIVMPYLSRAYRVRGSGVAFEAIRSNAFLLASEDLDIGATFNKSGRVIEYQPDAISEDKILEVVEKVQVARCEVFCKQHPAQIYKTSFFECVVEDLMNDNYSSLSALTSDDRFSDLKQILEKGLPIDKLNHQLYLANFSLV